MRTKDSRRRWESKGISLIIISKCINSQITIFRTIFYAGLLTFYWIGDRGLNWPRIASPSGVKSQPVFLGGQS